MICLFDLRSFVGAVCTVAASQLKNVFFFFCCIVGFLVVSVWGPLFTLTVAGLAVKLCYTPNACFSYPVLPNMNATQTQIPSHFHPDHPRFNSVISMGLFCL